MTDKLDAERLYYVKKKNGDVCIRQSHLFSTLKTEKAVPFVDFDDDDIEEVLAPVPTWVEYKKLKYAHDMFISQVPDTGLDRKLIEQENNIKELRDRVKLLKAALRYSNSTVKWVLLLIETTCDARIVSEIEEMLNKTNKVLK